jgi:myb proto-oncogene protein
LDPSIDRTTGRTGKWVEDEDIKLKDAAQTHGGKNWGAIAALVPDRTRIQCHNRWVDVLDPNETTRRTGTWTAVEDRKLKGAVQTHGGKNWAAIAALVPGRTNQQCLHRWKYVLDPSFDRTTRRTGKWTENEDIKLKDALQTQGAKDWATTFHAGSGSNENTVS